MKTHISNKRLFIPAYGLQSHDLIKTDELLLLFFLDRNVAYYDIFAGLENCRFEGATESVALCGYTQATNDHFNWMWAAGGFNDHSYKDTTCRYHS